MAGTFRVLYIDDEPGLLEIAKRFLEKTTEFSVDIETSAEHALQSIGKHSYHAIISDYQMPEMDGIALLKAVRSNHGNIPFILFTGRGREEVVIEAINNGVDFYLQKGGDPKAQFAELAHKIRQAIARRQAELSVIESEKQLSDIINFLPDATFAIDRSGRVIAWNRAIEEMTGVSAADILGKGEYEYAIPFYGSRRRILIDLIFESDDLIAAKYANIVHEKDQLIADTTLPRPQGRMVTLMGKASPLYDRQGEVIGAIESIRDITALKMVEEELRAANEQLSASQEELQSQFEALILSEQQIRESEEKFRDLAEMLPQMIYEMDLNFRVTYANRYALSAIGLTEEDIAQGISGLSYIDPSDQDRVRENAGKIVRGEPVENREYTALRTDGTTFPVLIYTSPVYRDGKIDGLRGVIIDITDRKNAEDMLKDREAILASIFRAAPVGVGLVSNRILLRVNDRLCEMTGYSAGELVGRSARVLYPSDDEFNRVGKEKYDQIRNYGTGTIETSWQRKDGAIREILLSSTPLDPDDLVKGVTFTAMDITYRKLAEEKYRTLIETTGTGYVILDDQGWVLDANPEYVRLTGHANLGEIVGRSVTEWTATYEKDKNLEAVKQCIREGFIRNLEIDYEDASGTITPIEINATVLQSGDTVQILTLCRDISKRRSTQEALLESEAKYRTVIEQSQDGIFIAQDGYLVFHNPSFATLTGYRSAELVGRSIADLIAPEDRELVITRHQKRLQGQVLPEVYEFSVLHHDGIRRIRVKMYITSATINGRPATIGTLHNMMEERRREEALRESEERFRRLISSSFDAVVVHQNSRIVFANDEAVRISGAVSNDELVGRPILDLVYPEYRANVAEWVREMLQSPEGTVPLVEEKFVRFDGTAINVEVMATATLHDGQPAVMVLFRDITGRKHLEDNLQEKTEELNQYFMTSLDLFCIADTDGFFRRLNPEWEKALGYTLEELEGHRFLDFVHPDDLNATLATIADLAGQNEVLNFTNRYRHKDGTYRWIEWRSFPRGDLIYAAARDITERRNMENAIREANRKLSLLNSVTRHDVANQLTILQGYTEIAATKNPAPEIADFLARIEASSHAIARLIEFTRTYQELGVHSPAWFRIDQIIAKAGNPGVTFSDTCTHAEIFADPMLERVFFNLLDNAVRHGERVTGVTFRCKRDREGLVIIVEDNGVGIPEDEKEKIFMRGYGKNTGLGLFLAREILAITGITIRETGTPGIGARFEILVPVEGYRFNRT
ncbi:MAG: PAS domain S-box protein [Methanomicrobiales archaeon]